MLVALKQLLRGFNVRSTLRVSAESETLLSHEWDGLLPSYECQHRPLPGDPLILFGEPESCADVR